MTKLHTQSFKTRSKSPLFVAMQQIISGAWAESGIGNGMARIPSADEKSGK